MESLRKLVEFEDYSHYFGARLYPHIGNLTLVGVAIILVFGVVDSFLADSREALGVMWLLRLGAALLLGSSGWILRKNRGGWGPARLTLYLGILSFLALAANYIVLTDHLELAGFTMVFFFLGVHALGPLLRMGDFLLASVGCLLAAATLMLLSDLRVEDYLLAGFFAVPLQFFLGLALVTSQRAAAEQYDLARQNFLFSALDTMTQLLNRRTWYEQAGSCLRSRARHQGTLAFLMLDIDHFKRFNDTWGHDCGDIVIREVASQLVAGTRGQDVVGRLGGEEFGILLPETELPGAVETAERIRHSVESLSLRYGSQELTVTVSIGVAAVRVDREDLDVLVKQGDEALYQAKKAGRNRTVALPDPSSSSGSSR